MKLLTIAGISLCVMLSSCEKEYLSKKPNKALLVPATLEDFQALLDYTTTMNIMPALQVLAGDEYYTTGNGNGYGSLERNAHFWTDDVYESNTVIGDWSTPYQQIFNANIVLDGLKTYELNETETFKRIKGSALFYRSYAAFNLLQVFAAPYDPSTAVNLPGLPLPQRSDVNLRPGRGKLKNAYDQVTADLIQSLELLPQRTALKNRPTKPAAFALLARVYLVMQDYPKAEFYANECLKLYDKLLDYKSLPTTGSPFPDVLPNGNEEVIFYTARIGYAFFRSAQTKVNSELMNSYAAGDLRKSFYYNPSNGRFRGYFGLAVDEMYLIRAEARCRGGLLRSAVEDMNALLSKRFASPYVPIVNTGAQDELLKLILNERRKELAMRGLRWSDLRRLNQDPAFAVTLIRTIDGAEHLLLPGALKYTFPIPSTDLGDGVAQNPR